MTKSEAGRLGGQATVKKYGASFMSEIGKKGYAAQRAKYRFPAPGFKKWIRRVNRRSS